jgi:diguanylate cyclase (GGDEF)-like protein
MTKASALRKWQRFISIRTRLLALVWLILLGIACFSFVISRGTHNELQQREAGHLMLRAIEQLHRDFFEHHQQVALALHVAATNVLKNVLNQATITKNDTDLLLSVTLPFADIDSTKLTTSQLQYINSATHSHFTLLLDANASLRSAAGFPYDTATLQALRRTLKPWLLSYIQTTNTGTSQSNTSAPSSLRLLRHYEPHLIPIAGQWYLLTVFAIGNDQDFVVNALLLDEAFFQQTPARQLPRHSSTDAPHYVSISWQDEAPLMPDTALGGMPAAKSDAIEPETTGASTPRSETATSSAAQQTSTPISTHASTAVSTELSTAAAAQTSAPLQASPQSSLVAAMDPGSSPMPNHSAPQLLLPQRDAKSGNFKAAVALLGAATPRLQLEIPHQFFASEEQSLPQKLIIIFALGALISMFFVVAFAQGIITPLQALSKFARALGRGESIKLPAKYRLDEVGELRSSLYAMQQSLLQRNQQLRFQACHDALTGLDNRYSVTQQMETLLFSQKLYLVQLSIVGFKDINDSLGFASGDAILQQLAKRLQDLPADLLLEARLVARLDNVEFLLVFLEPPTPAQLVALRQFLQQNYRLVQSSIQLKLCLGVHYAGMNADVTLVLRQLSIAAHRAVRLGSSLNPSAEEGICYFEANMDDNNERQLTIIRDLPISFNTDEFFVTYQPKINLSQQRCVQAEALIRWHHPTLGVIPPIEFIKIAEYAGSIHFITQWMLQRVIADIAAWRLQGIQMRVSINLSVYDVLDSGLSARVLKLLQQHQLPSDCLAFEVTEDVVMQAPTQAQTNLDQLRQQGVGLALDNFGAGRSSLAFLKQLPIDEIKIDRLFVKSIAHDTHDQLIVKTSTLLAHNLGLSVTAEGVEDADSLAALQAAGCDAVQGYYFAKPLPAAEFLAWVRQFHQ